MTPKQLAELESLYQHWRNDTASNDRDIEIPARVMDLLPGILEHIKQLAAERDAALKDNEECAALLQEQTNIVGQSSGEIIRKLIKERDAAQKAAGEMRAYVAMPITLAPLDFQGRVKLQQHALSTDCGKGYHADSEWKPVLMVLEDIATDDLDRVSGGVKQSAQQALAHAAKLTAKEEK